MSGPDDSTAVWLSPEEAAVQIGMHPETIRRMLRTGAIRAIKLGRGPTAKWRIHAADWNAWLNSLVHTPSPSQSQGVER